MPPGENFQPIPAPLKQKNSSKPRGGPHRPVLLQSPVMQKDKKEKETPSVRSFDCPASAYLFPLPNSMGEHELHKSGIG